GGDGGREPPRRPRAEVPERGDGLAMALRLPGAQAHRGPEERAAPPAPREREPAPAAGGGGVAAGGGRGAGGLPRPPPIVRDAPPGAGGGHQDGAGAPRA